MSKLPYVKIDYGNGALGQTVSSSDGLLCLIAVGATDVDDTFVTGNHYALRNLSDLEDMGVTAENNPLIYKLVSEFYTEAEQGTKCYAVGYPSTLSMSQVLDKNNSYARSVVESTNGEIRGLVITAAPGANIEAGLDADIEAAKIAAQSLGEWATSVRYAPIFVLIDGVGYNGNPEELADMTTQNYNRVGVVIGSTEENAANQSAGLVAGRVAASSVQRNPGRVIDGALNVTAMYAGKTAVETADIETVHEKGYITFRTYTGISGYFIADDPLATSETDDYNQLCRRRVIDKAYRLAYGVLVEKLNDEIPVNSDGTIIETYATAFELAVENAIASNMTANGELSVDPSNSSDRGVECTVDRTVNVLSTSSVKAELRVRPHGYGKYITVQLGFTITA